MEKRKDYVILIVDDEKMNLDILGEILAPMSQLLIAKNGKQALALAEKHVPDLVLLDVLMPEMSGFEVIAGLKASSNTSHIPVIFITGLSNDEDEERGFFLGAVDYITKPFNKTIVKARINTHIRIIDQMRTIEQIAFIDPLTKISNRRGFDKLFNVEWEKAIVSKNPIGFMIIDADKFKNYNDTYGHPQGDVLLQVIASVFAEMAPRPENAARWGGEEFVMMLPGKDIDETEAIAEKVRKEVEALLVPNESGEMTVITVSIGINSVIPEEGTDIGSYVKKADEALYVAKASGRNCVARSND
ncbi:MAG: diguanylate cyclase [Lachnospiraceae bacterium]|jgi:diguanylate cyclase (GGDEF)-like protein|nr:diguanylate cyclase [Lachnospiraceae bacterium]